MLFKKKAIKTETPARLAARPPAAPSFLAHDLMIVGTLMSEGQIVIEGHVEGPIYGAQLVLGETGEVKGDMIASQLQISGHVLGNLAATRIWLREHGAVEGDIHYQTLAIETGGLFNGACRHSDNPLAGAAEHITQTALPLQHPAEHHSTMVSSRQTPETDRAEHQAAS